MEIDVEPECKAHLNSMIDPQIISDLEKERIEKELELQAARYFFILT